MATISITIADSDLARVVSDFCGYFGYQAVIPSIVSGLPGTPNPETQNQFARRMIVQQIKMICQEYEAQQAAATGFASGAQVGVS